MYLSSISQPASTRVSPIARDYISPSRIGPGPQSNRSSRFAGVFRSGSNPGHYVSARSTANSPLPSTLVYPNQVTDPTFNSSYPAASASYAATGGGGGGHGFPYYDDPGSPIMDARPLGHLQTGLVNSGVAGPGAIVHGGNVSSNRIARSSRVPINRAYQSLDARAMPMDPMMERAGIVSSDPYLMSSRGPMDPLMRDPRDRSLDRYDLGGPARHGRPRDRSLDRSFYLRDEHPVGSVGGVGTTGPGGYRDMMMEDAYRDAAGRSMSHSVPVGDPRHAYSRDSMIMELQARLTELQSQYAHIKRELDATTQKLGSSMHSIKTFWSPELKKERALRKEEAAKYALLSDQLKILRSENQVITHSQASLLSIPYSFLLLHLLLVRVFSSSFLLIYAAHVTLRPSPPYPSSR